MLTTDLIERVLASVPGKTVGLLGDKRPRVLPPMEIIFKDRHNARPVYDFQIKQEWEKHVYYECPAKLPADVTRELEATSLAVWDALGCRDVARLDFRVRDGVPYFLEVNPLPGLNPESSDLVIMARLLGVSHAGLVERIVSQ